MPHTALLRLLPPAARSTRPASPHPRLDRGGARCRVLSTTDMLAEIGEAYAPITAEQALTALSAAVDRAIAQDIAA